MRQLPKPREWRTWACERSSVARRPAAVLGSQRVAGVGCAHDYATKRGSPREGARSELASGAATGGGGPQAPPKMQLLAYFPRRPNAAWQTKPAPKQRFS